ncbi:MAG: DsbA family protein [Actinomycetota bacterium]|nr:DsbA family protein [Actinomycetota bacterium]
MRAAAFYYDFSSPYSYLAASRIAEVVPGATWRPIAFGFVLQRTGRVPWSFADDRSAHTAEIDRRAAERGLPPVRYPEGWPAESYSLAALRAALLAEERGRLAEFTHAAYAVMFAEGRALDDPAALGDAAVAAELDVDDVERALQRQEIKDRLRDYTGEALERGLVGVPTVAVDGELFWGDDRLDEAAVAAGTR